MLLSEARLALRGLASGLPDRGGRIGLAVDGNVGRLVIDHPAARNALTARLMADLADAVEQVLSADVSVVFLSATGPVFCAGGHLDDVQQALIVGDNGLVMARAMTAVLDAFRDGPFVSIAVIDGPALGGGAELTTACDLRACGPKGAVHFVQAALGVTCGWGGAARLVDLVGRTAAVRILAGAARIGPEEGARIGLFNALAPAGASGSAPGQDAADQLAEPILAVPPAAARAAKRQVVAARDAGVGRDAEARVFSEVWGGPAHRAALARVRPK